MRPRPSRRGRGWSVGLALAAGATLIFVRLAIPADKAHPPLVSVEATNCSSCHKALLAGREHVHPPVQEDCATCHEVAITPAGTTITLSAEEPDLCLACHYALDPATGGERKSVHAPTSWSCTACHEPHASTTPRLLTASPAELCATCHDHADLQGTHGGQLTTSTNCLACHDPHGSDNATLLVGGRLHPPFAEKSCEACHRKPLGDRTRLQARGEALCTSCHGDIPLEPGKEGSWHPALEAQRPRLGCLSCHDPHLSANARLLVRTGPSLCAPCHAETVRAATAETGHPPASDDCLSCHQPHSAPGPHLLAESPPPLCLLCHDAEDETLRRAHLGADVGALECTSCHSPHGAGQPHLLARYVHPPALDDCQTCHEGRFDRLFEDGESPLCLACHGDVGTQASSAAVPHPALEMVRCADCHNPHASPQQRLIKASGGRECLLCHFDKAAEEGEHQHGAIGLVGCRACHEPHGGARPKLLRATGNDLCLGCHAPRAAPPEGEALVSLAGRFEVPAKRARALKTVLLSPDGQRGHPIPTHPVAGQVAESGGHESRSTFTGELGCLACHDPHKGASEKLLRFGAISAADACLHCHVK